MQSETNLLSLVDWDRMANITYYVNDVKELKGSLIEFGVYKGGTLQEIARREREKQIYAIDSFHGLPEKTDGIDTHKLHNFSDTSYEEVKKHFEKHPNVFIMKGVFPSDFYGFVPNEPLIFAHVDVDMYESTKKCLDWTHIFLRQGGVILCDDYGCPDCPGAKLAVHEFLAKTGTEYSIEKIVNCQITLRRCYK